MPLDISALTLSMFDETSLPSCVQAKMLATAINVAMSAYSTAVAPFCSVRKRRPTSVFTLFDGRGHRPDIVNKSFRMMLHQRRHQRSAQGRFDRQGGGSGSEKETSGRGDRIRTCDPLLPKQMRYQAALLPDAGCLRRSVAATQWAVRDFIIMALVGPAGLEPATKPL